MSVTIPPLGGPRRRLAGAPTAAALVIGGLGGALFAALGLPLPWLLGALATTTVASLAGIPIHVPDRLRWPMIAVLGVLLGTTFTLDRLDGALGWLSSLAALPVYVVVVGGVILLYLRRFSGFDRTTAFFAATPGGLSEMIALSGQFGADQRRVSLVHATRLLFIVFTIPFLARQFGSGAAAPPPDPAAWDLPDLSLLAAMGALGYVAATRLRLPAATFMGPLLGSAAAHLAGWVEVTPPYALMALAQLVIGASVGARFSGAPLALIWGSLMLGAGATVIMLAITLVFGAGLHVVTGYPLGLLLLAFIPGGFTEMSLIALAMGVDPAFVVTHHSIRVFLVVLIALPAFALLQRSIGTRTSPEPEGARADGAAPSDHPDASARPASERTGKS